MHGHIIAAIAVLSVGCVDPSVTVDTDGARLQRQHRVASDGAVETLPWWFDTEVSALCTFRLAKDGATRCLPMATSALYYTDAECTARAIYMYEPLCGDPVWSSWFDEPLAMCFFGGEHIARVVGRAGVASVFYSGVSGCVEEPVGLGFVVLTLGPELAPSSFVDATIE